MKHRYLYIFALITLFVMSGCNDWLDVSPRQEIREPDLFSNEEGFKDALTGVYIQMAESPLYGRNTSMYMPEFMARHWSLSTDQASFRYGFENFDFTNSGVESMINTVCLEYYNVLAQLNSILTGFEENEVHFNYANEKLIKGEALALRAFLHFELLRYFGPAPLDAVDGENAIPYVTEMTRDATLLVSRPWSEVVSLIQKDFDEAETLLLEADPIVTGETFDDEWATLYRENRFNYYAVLGAKARFYQWIGNKEKATEYARMVVDAENEDGDLRFNLADNRSDYELVGANLIMYSEMLFGVHNPRHQSVVEALFKGESATLTQLTTDIADAYPSSDPSDIRNRPNRYWEVASGKNYSYFRKYVGSGSINPANVVPIIRLAELYLILIENEPLDVANELFYDFCIARGMVNLNADLLTDDDVRKDRLEKEYRKEFYGEGQMFFFYKRLKYNRIMWPPSAAPLDVLENGYVLPLPKNQMAFE